MAEGALGPGILGTDIPGVGLGESVHILSKAYRIICCYFHSGEGENTNR